VAFLRYYVEIAGNPGQPRGDVEADLGEMVQAVLDEMLQPDVNGLDMPPPLTE
jgi:hypothetical protein